MKISGKELENIIKEEVSKYLGEQDDSQDKNGQGEKDTETTEAIKAALSSGSGLTMLQNKMPKTAQGVLDMLTWIIKTDIKTTPADKIKAIEVLFKNRAEVARIKDR
jgi:hypothetical protein